MSKSIFGHQEIKPIVWKKYEGEEIIEKIVISGGVKNYHRKYIPRSVFHDPEDKPAFILGNAPSIIRASSFVPPSP